MAIFTTLTTSTALAIFIAMAIDHIYSNGNIYNIDHIYSTGNIYSNGN
jgi:hypothetical protein